MGRTSPAQVSQEWTWSPEASWRLSTILTRTTVLYTHKVGWTRVYRGKVARCCRPLISHHSLESRTIRVHHFSPQPSCLKPLGSASRDGWADFDSLADQLSTSNGEHSHSPGTLCSSARHAVTTWISLEPNQMNLPNHPTTLSLTRLLHLGKTQQGGVFDPQPRINGSQQQKMDSSYPNA